MAHEDRRLAIEELPIPTGGWINFRRNLYCRLEAARVLKGREGTTKLAKLFSMDVAKDGKTLTRQDSKPKARVPVRKVKLWTRLSPLHLFRVLRDTYVKGCVTFGNSSKVNAISHGAAFQIASDDYSSFSRSSSRNHHADLASAQELLDLSAKFSREVLEQESVQSGRKHQAAVITGHQGKIMLCLSYSTCALNRSNLQLSCRPLLLSRLLLPQSEPKVHRLSPLKLREGKGKRFFFGGFSHLSLV